MNTAPMSDIQLQLKSQRGNFALNIELELPAYGITALFGRSGSGKTSLLRALSGLEPAHGLIRINGRTWQDDANKLCLPTHQRRIGYVFQDTALFPHLSVRGNLDYGYMRTPTDARRLQPEQVIDWLGLAPLLQRSVPKLSGGETQRVAIARALLTSPSLLLLDEPLAALDSQSKHDILPYLERLHRELSLPVLYVSHALDEVLRLADHLVLLEAGQVKATGPLDELLTRLELPLSHSDLAAAVIAARVSAIDKDFGLAYLDSTSGRISLAASGLEIDQPVRVRIAARDVGLALQAPNGTSILNCLPVTIKELSEQGPAQMLVRLEAGGTPLLARITRKSCVHLQLAPGKPVYALIKSVALVD